MRKRIAALLMQIKIAGGFGALSAGDTLIQAPLWTYSIRQSAVVSTVLNTAADEHQRATPAIGERSNSRMFASMTP
jgi:hypothetical protein